MGKYLGHHPFSGTIGNLTYARTQNGEVIVKQKTSVDRERILTDIAYKRTREVMADFSTAGKSGKFLLQVFREAVLHKPDSRIAGRLQKKMMAIGKTDQSHPRGQKQVWAGDLSLMEGFEFNKNSEIRNGFWGNFDPSIDRVTGDLKVVVQPYVPEVEVQMPPQATHYRLVAAGIALDLEGEAFVRERTESAYLPLTKTPTSTLTLTNNIGANSTLPLFVVFGIEYALEEDGEKFELSNGKFNAVRIVQVDA